MAFTEDAAADPLMIVKRDILYNTNIKHVTVVLVTMTFVTLTVVRMVCFDRPSSADDGLH